MKYVLHSVSYAGFWRNQASLGLEDFLRKAAELGYDGVEIMAKRPHASPLDLDEERKIQIGDLLKQLNLECACLAAYTDFTSGMDSKFIPSQEMQLIYIDELIKLAAMWNCRLIRVFSGYCLANVSYWQQWDACVKGLKECAKRAQRYGITIGVQNHHDIAADANSMLELLNEIDEPNCKVMLDAWVPAVHGVSLEETVNIFAGNIAYTTAADYIYLPRYKYLPDNVNYEKKPGILKAVPMGEGFIDYALFFKALRDTGYDGYVAYEMCSELRGGGSIANLDSYARRFLTYMKELYR